MARLGRHQRHLPPTKHLNKAILRRGDDDKLHDQATRAQGWGTKRNAKAARASDLDDEREHK